MEKISSFCEKNDILVLNMNDDFVIGRWSRAPKVTNLHHYSVDCLYTVVDLQLQEFNDRFNEVNSELLICMSSLHPRNSFQAFSQTKLLRLAEFYPDDFSRDDIYTLEADIRLYIDGVRKDDRFAHLESLGSLAQTLVSTRKHHIYPLVYRLLKLTLTLLIATATVERCFSAMKLVKTNLRNRISDSFLNDCVISYVEIDLLDEVSNDVVIDRFQKMKTRRCQLH